ncbi:copper resistance protein B [Sphingobium algorifonticola]|uniref:Copper resistance protein B n=1 Tax=Sphingobium algorifonticola TaxID=2008318 RepID=A0A437J994_9SPHN|nr:copper resistance protein B [Sphingobium algorifonticola]RVT42076.1 copper resistance protein B [Sphingobium algorifonticola]
MTAAALATMAMAMAFAQAHAGHGAPASAPAVSSADCPPEHAAMGHCTPTPAPPADPAIDPAASGTALPPGNAPAPVIERADYADRIWGRAAMAPVRAAIRREHGGMMLSQIMVDIAEMQVRNGREGYRWEGEGWFGGDINRLVVKTEGEGDFGERVEDAEAQALYSRAIDPYFNVQAGVRQDFEPAGRTYAAVGVEGLAPYWFEIEAHGFLSTGGDLLGRVAASYDQRITQRLILQPRIELNLAAQDIAASGIGAGLSEADVDLRLRYEIRREFAPYIGITHRARIGRTADIARARGEDAAATSFVIGLRAWF